ncbi:single-stranded DNA-binding protein [Microtetraspora glauca]|uniref:Single-stranded DNA-binding protein n=1 Tax=Microtetraspora glauca TaxID=1996 RepID=A0ABV3GFL8_MICGL
MHLNSVVLRGRLSMEAEDRALPSGVVLTRWRLAVRRPEERPGHRRADGIECATFDDDVRAVVSAWRLDDVVEVEGAVRRRWWRGGSRYEIEVRTARRIEGRRSSQRSRAPAVRSAQGEETAEIDHPSAASPTAVPPLVTTASAVLPSSDSTSPAAFRPVFTPPVVATTAMEGGGAEAERCAGPLDQPIG